MWPVSSHAGGSDSPIGLVVPNSHSRSRISDLRFQIECGDFGFSAAARAVAGSMTRNASAPPRPNDTNSAPQPGVRVGDDEAGRDHDE